MCRRRATRGKGATKRRHNIIYVPPPSSAVTAPCAYNITHNNSVNTQDFSLSPSHTGCATRHASRALATNERATKKLHRRRPADTQNDNNIIPPSFSLRLRTQRARGRVLRAKSVRLAVQRVQGVAHLFYLGAISFENLVEEDTRAPHAQAFAKKD